MSRLIGTRIFGDGSIYWVVPYFLLLTACGLFMLWSVRRSVPAMACLISAGAGYAIAAFMQSELVLRSSPALETWAEESCEMLGDLFLLLTLGLYARSLVFKLKQARRAGKQGSSGAAERSKTGSAAEPSPAPPLPRSP